MTLCNPLGGNQLPACVVVWPRTPLYISRLESCRS